MFETNFRKDNDYRFLERKVDVNIFSDNIAIGPRVGTAKNINDLFEKDENWQYNMPTNPFGHRSEPFIKNHNKKHILFAGCSNTVGEGLFFKETWSYKLFDTINSQTQLSGFYNFSLGGIGFVTIISNIFKYFREYGNPNTIFINFPDLLRFYSYDTKTSQYFYSSKIEHDFSNMEKELENSIYSLKLCLYHYYLMLEQYCFANNIQLISFTWDIAKKKNKKIPSMSKIFKEFNFNSFVDITEKELADYVNEYIIRYPDQADIAIVSRDKEHSGVAINSFWSEKIFKKYLELENQ